MYAAKPIATIQGPTSQSSWIAQLVLSHMEWGIATDASDSRQYVAKRAFVGASNGLRDMVKARSIVKLEAKCDGVHALMKYRRLVYCGSDLPHYGKETGNHG